MLFPLAYTNAAVETLSRQKSCARTPPIAAAAKANKIDIKEVVGVRTKVEAYPPIAVLISWYGANASTAGTCVLLLYVTCCDGCDVMPIALKTRVEEAASKSRSTGDHFVLL